MTDCSRKVVLLELTAPAHLVNEAVSRLERRAREVGATLRIAPEKKED